MLRIKQLASSHVKDHGDIERPSWSGKVSTLHACTAMVETAVITIYASHL